MCCYAFLNDESCSRDFLTSLYSYSKMVVYYYSSSTYECLVLDSELLTCVRLKWL